MTQNFISIPAPDGCQFQAYIARPDVTPAPVIIVIQEIFGVNAELQDKCEALADAGYIALAPDLFWRIEPGIQLSDSVPEQLQRAFHLFGEFNLETGLQDLETTLKFARSLPGANGRAGCIGYCLGGKLAYLMAARTSVDVAVGYYGVGIGALLNEAKNITAPLLLHIAGHDEFVPPEEQKKIEETLLEHETAQTYHYPGLPHAFARGNGVHYNEQAAKLANARTADFLDQSLRRAKAA
jgi:carboxymethylenebutenolidase